jgi:hypothetical protein
MKSPSLHMARLLLAFLLGLAVRGAEPLEANAASVRAVSPAQSQVLSSSALIADQELLQYRRSQAEKNFELSLSQVSLPKRTLIQNFLDGLYFIDFGHAAPELLEVFLHQRELKDIQFPSMYDHEGEPALASNKAAQKFLSNLHVRLTLQAVRAMHMHAAPWVNVDGKGPGTIRSKFVYGPEFENGLHPTQIEAINESPYLRFMPATGIYADVFQGVENAPLGDRIRGAIVYPRPRDLKPEAMNRLKASQPALAKKVLQYQKQFGADPTNRSEELTRELITALLKERVETFEKERAKLGELSTPAAVEKYVQLIANFQKDYVSIHPFPDGNGRTSRLLLSFLAQREGLPAPRLVYPNEDLFWKVGMWQNQIREGMVATAKLKQDLILRLKSSQPLEDSVALATPVLPIPATPETLNQFEKYLRTRFSQSAELKNQLKQDPVGTMRRLGTDFHPEVLPAQRFSCSGIHRAG